MEFWRLSSPLQGRGTNVVIQPELTPAGAWNEKLAAAIAANQDTYNAILSANSYSNSPQFSGAGIVQPIDELLNALLLQSSRTFGQPTEIWTPALAAEVSVAEGIIPERVSGEAIRLVLLRLGVSWRRAKHWITSPNPEYTRKKGLATV